MSVQCKVDVAMGLLSGAAVLAGVYHDFIGALLRVVVDSF